MIQLLIDNPILLLVVVAATGYLLSQVRVAGTGLGVASVLFAGLGFGALHPELRIPEPISFLGLVLFVYAIGLSSGASFFASFRHKGLRDNAFVFVILLLAAALAAGIHVLLDLTPAVTAGLFAGSLTNTPSLAGVVEALGAAGASATVLDEPVIGYSIAYPMGVVGVIAALAIAQRLWRVDFAAEAVSLSDLAPLDVPLETWTIRVQRPGAAEFTLAETLRAKEWDVRFGRVRRPDGEVVLADDDLHLAPGDLVTVVGTGEVLAAVAAHLGERATERLDVDRRTLDYRRIFVSNPDVTGVPLRELNLPARLGATVTRVRRGDVEWLAHDGTVLEPGDRVRVIARAQDLPAVSAFFGDSYRKLSEINLLSFSLGLMAGILVGLIPIPLPGDLTFSLGLAGGPLLAGLVLGKLGRTGPIVWHLPYSSNLLLRQVGLVFFFAGVGTRAGFAFFETLTGSGGLALFAGGAAVTCGTALAALWGGRRLLGMPFSLLAGVVAGVHTQPAVLSYAGEQTGNELPNVGYATVYPVATIGKLLIAQLLLALLPG